jgi:hypothetical protein
VSAPVCSRRVSAGIRPDPGAEAQLPAWWSADDWLADVADALTDELCRAHHVAPDTVLTVARGMAGFADFRTGRGCRPTNARLLAVCRLSLSTLKRARRVLEALEVVRRLIQGRSVMTRAERLAAWRRGSSHRQIAATFALCPRPRRAPKVSPARVGEGARFSGADLRTVDGGPPPGARKVSALPQSRRSHLRRQTDHEDPRSARSSYREGHAPEVRRLAEGARHRLGWLRGVGLGRIAPTLARFARAGWTPRDVDLAVRDALGARGWRVPAALTQPAAYLAALLREVDPADRPSVLEDAHAAAMAAAAAERRANQRRWHAALRTTCPHGVPAGDVPHPLSGALACPQCRTMLR